MQNDWFVSCWSDLEWTYVDAWHLCDRQSYAIYCTLVHAEITCKWFQWSVICIVIVDWLRVHVFDRMVITRLLHAIIINLVYVHSHSCTSEFVCPKTCNLVTTLSSLPSKTIWNSVYVRSKLKRPTSLSLMTSAPVVKADDYMLFTIEEVLSYLQPLLFDPFSRYSTLPSSDIPPLAYQHLRGLWNLHPFSLVLLLLE